MDIEVEKPMNCPFQWVDAEGFSESSCQILESVLIFEEINKGEARCEDTEEFPINCPLGKGLITVKLKNQER